MAWALVVNIRLHRNLIMIGERQFVSQKRKKESLEMALAIIVTRIVNDTLSDNLTIFLDDNESILNGGWAEWYINRYTSAVDNATKGKLQKLVETREMFEENIWPYQ